MGSKGDNPAPPTPIDPTKVIQAQAAANRVNQYGPDGNIIWNQGPNGTWSQTTYLSQPQQQLLNQGQLAGETALANLKTKPMQLQTGVDPIQFNKVSNNGVPVKGLDLSGVQGIPQADDAAYNKAVNSVYGQATSRLDPQWNQAQTALQTQLIDQGIPQNSDAWNKAMTQFQQGKNDAYNSAFNNAVTQGSQVENNLFNMGLQANQAGVGNALTAGQFANQAAGQRLNQALSSAGFNNQANQQGFQNSMANAQLNNGAESQRIQQYLNEAGLGNMYGHLTQANTGTPIDAMGAYSLNAQQQMAAYQAQMQQNAAKNGGIGSLLGTLGSAAIMA